MKRIAIILLSVIFQVLATAQENSMQRIIMCRGDSAILVANANNADYYGWYKNDSLLDYNKQLIVSNKGLFGVVAYNYNGCSSDTTWTLVDINSGAIAHDDTASILSGQIVAINLFANDKSPCSTLDSCRVDVNYLPLRMGNIVKLENGIAWYNSTLGKTGYDQFTYRLRDALGNLSNEATVNIIIGDRCSDTYPNPTTDLVTIRVIDNKVVGIRLCDLNGRILQKKVISSGKVNLDLSSYAEAVYIIHLVDKHDNILCLDKVMRIKPDNN